MIATIRTETLGTININLTINTVTIEEEIVFLISDTTNYHRFYYNKKMYLFDLRQNSIHEVITNKVN